jgi:hypothetical protein
VRGNRPAASQPAAASPFEAPGREPLDFLGFRRIRRRYLIPVVFYFLGFSWIPSSEMGDFNGLQASQRPRNIPVASAN